MAIEARTITVVVSSYILMLNVAFCMFRTVGDGRKYTRFVFSYPEIFISIEATCTSILLCIKLDGVTNIAYMLAAVALHVGAASCFCIYMIRGAEGQKDYEDEREGSSTC